MPKLQNVITKMEITEIYNDNIGDLTKYEQVERLAMYILDSKQSISAEKSISTKDLLAEYEKLCNTDKEVIELSVNTITVYLSKLSDDQNSRIYCEGKKQGYYLRSISPEEELEKRNVEGIGERQDELKKEKELYPTFIDWLECDCDKVVDISARRKMWVWGNPDILGLKTCTILGVTNLEISTIEVKRDIQKWRIEIFEAVAHSIFANRVYFAFECKQEDFRKEKKDMLLYAQKFNIGLLAKFSDVDDSSTIHEILPAPILPTNIYMKKRFLNAIGINNVEGIIKLTSATSI